MSACQGGLKFTDCFTNKAIQYHHWCIHFNSEAKTRNCELWTKFYDKHINEIFQSGPKDERASLKPLSWLRPEDLFLRGVLFADLFKLLVPGGSAVVGFLSEPGDHVFVLVRVDLRVIGLLQDTGRHRWVYKLNSHQTLIKARPDSHTYHALIPSGQVEFVGEEIPHPPLLHLALQHLQEVGEPLEGVRLPAEPVEVDLEPGSRRRNIKTMILFRKRWPRCCSTRWSLFKRQSQLLSHINQVQQRDPVLKKIFE